MTIENFVKGFKRGRKFIDSDNIKCSYDRTFVATAEGLVEVKTPKAYHLGKKDFLGGEGSTEFWGSIIGVYSRPVQRYATMEALKVLNDQIKE